MIRTLASQDVYIDGKLCVLVATVYEDTTFGELRIAVRDVAGPNVWTPILVLKDAQYVGETGQIRHWTGRLEQLDVPEDMMVYRVSAPQEVEFSLAPRAATGCIPCGQR